MLVLHVSPKGGRVEGARILVVARRCPLKGCVPRVLYMLALHEPTATATGPAAPTKGFERLKPFVGAAGPVAVVVGS